MSSGAHTTGKSHYLRSSYRESLVEHLFVGSLLKHFWNRDDYNVEVLNPQVDDAGYDLVIEHGGVIRHVQLKATFKGAKTAHVNLNAHLAEKPSGCVVAVVLEEGLIGANDLGVLLQALADTRTQAKNPLDALGWQEGVDEDLLGLLADAIHPASPLDEANDRPRQVIVDDYGAVLKVLPFAEYVGGDQHP